MDPASVAHWLREGRLWLIGHPFAGRVGPADLVEELVLGTCLLVGVALVLWRLWRVFEACVETDTEPPH